MSEERDILLLADAALARNLQRNLPAGSAVVEGDPFAALEELSRRSYRTVLIAFPQPDLPELLSAIRRLQPHSRLFGLCGPAGEFQFRGLRQEATSLLEDYFIIPPTRSEWRRILNAESAEPIASATAAALTPRQISELVESAGAVTQLQGTIRRLAEAALHRELRWAPRDRGRIGAQPLVTLETDPPQTLWSLEPLPANDNASQWLSVLRAVLDSLVQTARRTESLRRLAVTDDLTGAHNRRYFLHFGEKLLAAARDKKARATLLLYDIDDLKLYNDKFGHSAGDDVLRETAHMMRQITRKHDLVARIGGDEFAVLFCELEPARKLGSQPLRTPYDLANRFRNAVNSHQFKALGSEAPGTLTISGGLASFPWDGMTLKELLARADEALLAAKAEGKNNIFLTGEGPLPTDDASS